MNILGRVLGGILIFISLGWLASIAQVFPFSRSTNQLASPTAAPGATSKTAGANNAKNNRTATTTFTAPRNPNTVIAQNNTTEAPAGNAPAGSAGGTATSGAATSGTTAPATAEPVQAGW